MKPRTSRSPLPATKVDVVEPGRSPHNGWRACHLSRDIRFSTAALESYAFSTWEPLIFDAMLVAASVEYADRLCRRPRLGWTRDLSIRVPVDDPQRWEAPAVSEALLDAVTFVTGDRWSIGFSKRSSEMENPSGDRFDLFESSVAVLAYSEGMDSLAAAGIEQARLGDDIVRVRVGGKGDVKHTNGIPFVSVPYRVTVRASDREPTAMSRGFKFAMISGLAAYLTGANRIIVPESGQGALGPPLVPVGHAYRDYRNHPQFTHRMERFWEVLLGRQLRYSFPRLWHTKAETLKEYVGLTGTNDWRTTRSCWRDNRWSSVRGSRRHCGVCAACMLRRVSVHAAGLSEPADTYVSTDMRAATLESAVDPDFTRLTAAYREYAIAGVKHMDHLAAMADAASRRTVQRHATSLRRILRTNGDADDRLVELLQRHAGEWRGYLRSLGAGSFVNEWIRGEG